MIVKAGRGYYVYTKPSVFGKRKRIGGPFPSKTQAQKMHRKISKKNKNRRRQRRK